MVGVAELLRSARTSAGLTQAELARRAGTSQAAVARYESGDVSPVVSTLERLLAATGSRLELGAVTEGNSVMDLLWEHRDEIVRRAEVRGATNVRVFGSVARGEDGQDSDIDLLVDFDTSDGIWPLIELADELESILGRPVDVAPASLLKPEAAASALDDALAL